MNVDYAIKHPISVDMATANKFYNFMFDAIGFLDTYSLTDFILYLIENNPCENLCSSQIFQWVVEFLDEDPECYPYNDIDFDALNKYEHAHSDNIVELVHSYICNKESIINKSLSFPLSVDGLHIKSLNFPNAIYFNERRGLIDTLSIVNTTLESISIPSYNMIDGPSIKRVFNAEPSTELPKLKNISVADNDTLQKFITDATKGDFEHLSPFGRSLNEAIMKTAKGGSNV